MTDEPNFLGWDIDEITNQASEETPANVIPFTLQAEVVAPQPQRQAVPRIQPQAPPSLREEAYPWTPSEDEAFRAGAFRRSWHATSRREWNSDPIHSDGTMCKTCGYKWHPLDILESGVCFNCWMLDNKPDEVRRFWSRVASSDGKKHGETAAPVLVKLGEKKEK